MSWITQPPIVVPYDFSPDAREGVDKAVNLLGTSSGVHLIHVLGELSPAEPGEAWHTVDETTRTHHATQAIRKEFSDPAYADLSITIAFGDPGEQICRFAEDINATAIVTASHGRSAIMRVLVGSVADRIVRLAHCPVLILKKKRPA